LASMFDGLFEILLNGSITRAGIAH
jgi:hypothetical protein